MSPPKRPMGAERATLIYDGECGFCRDAVGLVARWDRAHRVVLVPFQDEKAVAAFGLPLPALAAAMHLILPDGRVFAGADAAAAVLRLLPGKRWLASVFALPGILPLARRGYAWIARRRRCLVRGAAAR
jgi:predicted DCC family thiol-disulfide oxidoreductase YuxK